MISAIIFNEKEINSFEVEYYKNYILGLKKINIFVGKNNSGKSRLLRLLVSENKNINFIKSKNNAGEIKSPLLNSVESTFVNACELASRKSIKLKNKDTIYQLIKSYESPKKSDVTELFNTLAFFKNINPSDLDFAPNYNQSVINSIIELFNNIPINAENNLGSIVQTKGLNILYIPILRGLRPIQNVSEHEFSNTDSYHFRTVHDYFKKSKPVPQIFTGISIYEDIMKLLLGTEEDRNEIKEFEQFLTDKIFFQKVTLIPRYKQDVLHIKIGSTKQFEIFNLGDGLQTIITILYPIFMQRKKESLIFIEEPEVHLHPEWQIMLLNALDGFDKHQYFISTHSASFINHPDSAVFRVSQLESKAIIKKCDIEESKIQILRDLGYSPSDLFLTNFVIWVEGPSDKVYLNYWINLLDKSLKEGVDYSIMLLGGKNNYQHLLKINNKVDLSFIKSINKNFGIILDSDREKLNDSLSKDLKEINEVFTESNLFIWITEYREVENYLPFAFYERAVKEIRKDETLIVQEGNFIRRDIIEKISAKPEYKSTIQLPERLFQQIQRQNTSSTMHIGARELRLIIEKALEDTKKATIKMHKWPLAKKIISYDPPLENEELEEKLKELIKLIKQANNRIKDNKIY